MTRRAVHTASGHRLGAANPRQEGPADLRLVFPALAAWAASALAVGAPGRWTALGAALCAALAALLLVSVLRPGARRAARAGGRDRITATATACAALLLCAAAGAVTAGLWSADLRRGPLPALAERYAHATVELRVSSDPRLTRPRPEGGPRAGRALVFDAEATEVSGAGREATAVRTPLLVVVRPGLPRPVLARWQSLLPSTGLRLTGGLAPPLHGADRYGAVLRVRGGGPEVIESPSAVQRTAGALRAGLRTASDGLPRDARALLPGLTVGDTSRVTPDLQEAFEATDLTHLLAVSGSNLGVVLILLVGPPGRALLAERGGLAPRLGITLRGTALLGGGLILAFVVVCRPEPSVLRAAACGAITLLAIGTGRRRSLLPALAAAVLLLVLHDPGLARSPGFVLSVLATGALLTIAPGWSAALRRRGVPPRLAEALAAAGAAQAVCAPVVVVLATRVSLVAIPCNLIAEPAVALATVLGFAALATAPVAMPAAEVLAGVAGWPAGWIAAVARAGASLPGAWVDWPGGWRGGVLLAAATALAVLIARRLWRRPWAASACALLLLLAVLRPAPLTRVVTGWPPPGWSFAMCDVGQGDATVLAAGDGTGAAVVVDVGPDPDLADRCLRELGVTRIPLIVLTHFHTDHIGGLSGVLRGRTVGAVQTTTLDEPRAQSAFVRAAAAEAGVPLVRAAPGERRRLGRLSWQVLWPDRAPDRAPGRAAAAVPPTEPNDASVTLLVRVEAGPVLLLLGDLEPPAQRGLLLAHPELPPVDVLKVAHHGSAHQHPALLAAARPRLALISTGRDNPYGHPSPHTVGALGAGGAVVLRTDRDGPIAVTGAGRSLRAGLRRGAVVTGRGRRGARAGGGRAGCPRASGARGGPRGPPGELLSDRAGSASGTRCRGSQGRGGSPRGGSATDDIAAGRGARAREPGTIRK
ncbi:ComEC/Rec2 family competence protein [Streptomyces sp. NPDC001889]